MPLNTAHVIRDLAVHRAAHKVPIYWQINTIPTAGNAISVVASLLFGVIADRTGRRKECCAVFCVIVIVANIMLSIWDIPKPALLFAFFLSFVSAAAQPLIIAWGQEVTQSNAELRQMLVATGNIFTYTFMAKRQAARIALTRSPVRRP
ncbi:hypothetical protein BDV10DRAFT_189564 [Aspergillus recurvatus]